MKKIRLGKTEIVTCKNGFGALPIQRVSDEEAVKILRKAYDNGITFFDTARFYSDSEHKIGLAFKDMREKVFIASKTMSTTVEEMREQLKTTLENLQTDYLDLYQFHNPAFCPKPGDGTGLYEEMLKLKEQGVVRHIGITNHRQFIAHEAIESGLYETLQFPFCYLATPEDLEIVRKCKEADMGFIAMKAMSGGLITHSDAAYAYLDQFDNVLPIWGVQRENELDEFLSYIDNPPTMENPAIRKIIEDDRAELIGGFCRGCGYCMPCPVGIEINNCARMSLMVRRAPTAAWTTEEWQKKMDLIDDCLECGQCKSKCPYGLDTPNLLKQNLEDYREIIAGRTIV